MSRISPSVSGTPASPISSTAPVPQNNPVDLNASRASSSAPGPASSRAAESPIRQLAEQSPKKKFKRDAYALSESETPTEHTIDHSSTLAEIRANTSNASASLGTARSSSLCLNSNSPQPEVGGACQYITHWLHGRRYPTSPSGNELLEFARGVNTQPVLADRFDRARWLWGNLSRFNLPFQQRHELENILHSSHLVREHDLAEFDRLLERFTSPTQDTSHHFNFGLERPFGILTLVRELRHLPQHARV